MNKFNVGTTYTTRSIGDHECIFSFTVISRTAKTVELKSRFGTKKRKIFIYDGRECVMPVGSYSMAPMLKA